MIDVTMKLGSERHSINMTGHAYVPESDQGQAVCAGASAIAYALAGYIANDPEWLVIRVHDMDIGSGNLSIDVSGRNLRPVFEMALIGLMQIAEKYPEHMKVRRQDDTE